MATVAIPRLDARGEPTARRALGRVALAAVLANATWFSATAIVPALRHDWGLSAGGAAWLAVAVQAGFIIGSVVAAVMNLPDRVELRRLIAGSAIAAAAANAALVGAGGLAGALPSRFLVGVALAGVYAPGVRLVATHYERGRGVATGVVVGALTLGSATPHLVRGLGDVPWQATIVATSALALLAAVAIRPVTAGAGATPTPPLDLGAAIRALRDRPVRLTTLGYLGHMWELYAFWAWLPAFFAASTAALVAVLLLWGASVIADSAQFSAAATELAEPRYAGSALMLQLALGLALTIASIRLVPLTAGAIGWRFALLPLAVGPAAGTLAMLRLRTLPAAWRLAEGRR